MIKKVLAGAFMGILSLAAQVPEKPLLKIPSTYGANVTEYIIIFFTLVRY